MPKEDLDIDDEVLENIARDYDDDANFEILDHLNAKLDKAEMTNFEYRQAAVENAR